MIRNAFFKTQAEGSRKFLLLEYFRSECWEAERVFYAFLKEFTRDLIDSPFIGTFLPEGHHEADGFSVSA